MAAVLEKWISKPPLRQNFRRIDTYDLLRVARTLPFNRPSRMKALESNRNFTLPKGYTLALLNEHDDEVDTDALQSNGTTKAYAPPKPFTRRMWVGGRFEYRRPISILPGGVNVEHTISKVEKKAFDTPNPKLFVTQRLSINYRKQPQPDAIEERTHIYMHPLDSTKTPPSSSPPKEVKDLPSVPPDNTLSFTPSPDLLFRFSALMFNAHRIHFDKLYAQSLGHEDVLVHGPLTALLLVRLASSAGNGPLVGFDYRATNPLLANRELTFNLSFNSDRQGARIWAVDDRGVVGMTANATFGKDGLEEEVEKIF